MKTYIGIDNGVTALIAIVNESSAMVFKTPIKKVLNYTKKKAFLHRIDYGKLYEILKLYSEGFETKLLIERPMINPTRWKATVSAIRAMEATLIAIETLKIPYEWIDSKEWQKALLPSGLEKQELKLAGLEVASRLYPSVNLSDFHDADGLLIAHYCRMKYK